MFNTPSFKKCLKVEQFQRNYLKGDCLSKRTSTGDSLSDLDNLLQLVPERSVNVILGWLGYIKYIK